MSEQKRKRAPVAATVCRALRIVWQSGSGRDLCFLFVWIAFGAVGSLSAVLNAKFLNAAALVVEGKSGAVETAALWLGIWAVLMLLIRCVDTIKSYCLTRMRMAVAFFLEEKSLEKVSQIKLRYFDDREAQRKIRSVKGALNGAMSNIVMNAMEFLRVIFTVLTSFFVVFQSNWFIALFILVTTIPAIMIERRYTEKKYRLSQENSFEKEMQRYLSLVMTKRKYSKEMRFYRLYDYIEDKYDQSVMAVHKQQMKEDKLHLAATLGAALFTYGAIAIALILVSMDILKGTAPIGTFILVYNSARLLQDALRGVFQGVDAISSEGRYLEDYETIMSFEEEAVSDIGNLQQAEIRFEHVSFSYPGTGREVLRDVNVTIRPGEKISIVGENGSGKSTFVALLTGLYVPTKGRILVNGKDYTNHMSTLRTIMSCTMQEFMQHQATVEENVMIGDIAHTHGKEEVLQALQKAGLETTIDQLPQQEETFLGNLYDNSVDFSGGQWQKLAMARNLIKDTASIMILDEPTAALDPMAEAQLYRDFSELTQDKTVILISHRLGATRLTERVLVFDDGRIIEDGTHAMLLDADKKYAQMYNAQAQWYQNAGAEWCG